MKAGKRRAAEPLVERGSTRPPPGGQWEHCLGAAEHAIDVLGTGQEPTGNPPGNPPGQRHFLAPVLGENRGAVREPVHGLGLLFPKAAAPQKARQGSAKGPGSAPPATARRPGSPQVQSGVAERWPPLGKRASAGGPIPPLSAIDESPTVRNAARQTCA